MELQHGCRSEYGPLELRLETTTRSNGFLVYVEDLRLEHPTVHEHAVQSSLESAKEYAALKADEYLDNRGEDVRRKAKWRCS
jgi:hypothetical protein